MNKELLHLNKPINQQENEQRLWMYNSQNRSNKEHFTMRKNAQQLTRKRQVDYNPEMPVFPGAWQRSRCSPPHRGREGSGSQCSCRLLLGKQAGIPGTPAHRHTWLCVKMRPYKRICGRTSRNSKGLGRAFLPSNRDCSKCHRTRGKLTKLTFSKLWKLTKDP